MEQSYTTSVQIGKGLQILLFRKNFIHFMEEVTRFTCRLYKRVIQQEVRSSTCVRLHFTTLSSLTFTSRALDKKSLNITDQLSGFDKVGDGPVWIRRRAFNGGSWKWGGTPSAISIAVIPSDHTSTLFVYPSPWMSSGDHPKRSSHLGFALFILGSNTNGKTEICQFDLTVSVDENIVRFDI